MLLEMERDVCGVATEGRRAETWKPKCVGGDQGPMLPTALLLNSKREVGRGRKEEKRRREERKEGRKEGRKGGDGRRKSRAMKLLMHELLVSLRVKF